MAHDGGGGYGHTGDGGTNNTTGGTTTSNGTSSSTSGHASSSAKQAGYAQRAYYANAYPRDLWFIVTSIVVVMTFLNLFSVYWAWKRRHALCRGTISSPNELQNGRTVDTEKATSQPARKSDWRNLPYTISTASRIVAFRKRIPYVSMTMFEVGLTTIYVLAMLLFTLLYTGNAILQIEARAAYLCTTQFPLIIALAMKNNVIQFLTGVSHEKLNLMHRVISRVLLVQVWVHGFGVLKKTVHIWRVTWQWMGVLCGVAHVILTLTSFKFIRKRFYEFFWIMHVVFVVLFLIGGVWHTIGARGDWAKYMWACVAVWAQDRTCRYIRYLILSNFHPPNKSPARVELLSEDTIRVTVRRTFHVPLNIGRSWADSMGWKAGQHFFLAFPTIGPVESHPFTIANMCEPIEGNDNSKESEIMWIVRVREGLTQRLKEHVVTKKGSCDLPIFMDGPYGAPPDITGFDTCVFVAGGSGVAFTIPRLRDLLIRLAKRDACAGRVVFIWAIREAEHLHWISKDLVKAVATAPAGVELSIQVYITSSPALSSLPALTPAPSSTDSTSSTPSSPVSPTDTINDSHSHATMRSYSSTKNASSDDIEKTSVSTHTANGCVDLDIKGVDVIFGRPNMHDLLEDIVTNATGTVSVDLSGPEGLVSAVRSALSSEFAGPMNVLRGGATVQLNVEDFTM